MKQYNVTITEMLKMTVTVEANSRHEAEQKVSDSWYKAEYILDADNFVSVDFLAEDNAKTHLKKSPKGRDER